MKTIRLANKALNITIGQDIDAENPLDWNTSIKVAYVSNNYILGNEKVSSLTDHIMDLLEYGGKLPQPFIR